MLVDDVINDAALFFNNFLNLRVDILQTGESDGFPTYDLVDWKHEIELGSYGIRTYKNFTWIYGTGLAEPRASYVLNKQRNG